MPMFIDETKYLTVTETAAILSTTETKVLMLLKRRALEGELCGDIWMISRSSVESYHPKTTETENILSCRSSCNSSTCGCH
uniref:DNA-binding protein n=1 Tax=Geobacter sp. (strain M21) TaxID=443144 RepID=C6E862_GEOSM